MRYWYSTLVFCLFGFSALSQISIIVDVVDATCSANGSISVDVTGATGNLTYQLTGPCLPGPITQQSNVFNLLAPCEYSLVVTDGATGASASEIVTVGGDYQNPDIALTCGSCGIEAMVTGGLPPLEFSISSVGLGGPFVANTPSDNPTFTNIQSGSNYWVKVTDACGNVSVETCQTTGDQITGFIVEVSLNGTMVVTGVVGGGASLGYTLTSSLGTFSNATGVFPASQWGCNMSITVTDGCTSFAKPVSVRPVVMGVCTNFTEGTAEVGEVINAIPPLTYNYIAPDGTITAFSSNQITGLPPNANYYQFQVVDACGNKSDNIYKQKKYPVFDQNPVSCSEPSIELYTPNGGCDGGFDADSWPFQVTCLSCTPVEMGSVDSSDMSLIFNNGTPGNWVFEIEDGCGDNMHCYDSIMLEVVPGCDSIHAYLIDRFFCDNGTFSDRPMDAGGAIFFLKNQAGATLASNDSGHFAVPLAGTYTISVAPTGCGNLEGSASTGTFAQVDPVMDINIYNAVQNGVCQTFYQFIIDPQDGPFWLIGGPNNDTVIIDQNLYEGTCRLYKLNGILPGDYVLMETDQCGQKMLHLPKPEHNLEAVPFGNCPGSGTITVTGARNLAQWQDWGATNNVDINWPNSMNDVYSLDFVGNNQNPGANGSPYTFVNVQPGQHTLYLYSLGSNCAIDTAVVDVPDVSTLDFDVTSGVLCDGASTTNVVFEVVAGKPPYVLEQIDCNNLTQVLTSYNFSSTSFEVPDLPVGDYCFRLVDSCVISLDHQLSVRYFQDDIELTYNCDNTVTLKVDSLNATYVWHDANGVLLGTSHKLTLPNPGAAATYTVQVDIGDCIVERSVNVPATEIVPSVNIDGPTHFCEGDTILLQASINDYEYLWSTGSTATSLTTNVPGTYQVTVTNEIGCTSTATFSANWDIPIVEIEVLNTANGYGLHCFADSNGVLQAVPTQGIAPYQFSWSTQAATPQIENLKAGSYGVTIVDSIGCVAGAQVELTQPDLFVPSVNASAPRCFGFDDGEISVPAWSGGVAPVTASLVGAVPKQVPIRFDNLAPGFYDLSIVDANGCTLDTSFFFDAPQQLMLELGSDLEIELGDSIFLDPILNFSPVDSFIWSSNQSLDGSNLRFWHVPLDNAFYELTVWDEHNCGVSDKLNVQVSKKLDVYIPTAFSPNSDGINDLFTVYARSTQLKAVKRFQVFSRFGELVFLRENFEPNVEILGWDGKLDGRPMNPAVFAWKAEIELVDGSVQVLYGDVTLVR